MRRFEDRVAVVTGAGSGIGRATALRLAGRGCHLALADVDRAGLEATARAVAGRPAQVSTHVVDVASAPAMEAFARAVEATHGAAHVLVNNAGVALAADFAGQRLDDLAWQLGVNYWGVVHGCHFFLPLLRRQDEAHIVNLSSMFGFLGLPGQSGYCAAKAAVRALSESLYAELRDEGIGVTTVHPGCIATSIVRSGRIADEALRRDVQALFDRRGAPPDVVAAAIVRGIERNRLFVRVRPESFATDWLKRIFPVGIHRVVARRRAAVASGGPARRAVRRAAGCAASLWPSPGCSGSRGPISTSSSRATSIASSRPSARRCRRSPPRSTPRASSSTSTPTRCSFRAICCGAAAWATPTSRASKRAASRSRSSACRRRSSSGRTSTAPRTTASTP